MLVFNSLFISIFWLIGLTALTHSIFTGSNLFLLIIKEQFKVKYIFLLLTLTFASVFQVDLMKLI